MKFRFLLIPLFVIGFSVGSYADEGLDISYKLPFVPFEISFGKNGISFSTTRTIVTPLGSFSLGYSKYAHRFDEDYTYIIIEDMNQKKEHIYKVKDKQSLKLVSEGRTEITIKNRRVRILVEKGSRFTVKFSVEGKENSMQSNSNIKWLKIANSICKRNGGKISKWGCQANWNNAKKICWASGGRLMTKSEAKQVTLDCGVEIKIRSNVDEMERNKNNTSYQSCYKQKGFSSSNYWCDYERNENSFAVEFYRAIHPFYGDQFDNHYVRCR
jgi:hypothetical protein